MSDEVRSEAHQRLSSALEEICKKLTELSKEDFSNLHVGVEWSWMPYVKDHLDFLLEQTGGCLYHLVDSPPPAKKDFEIENLQFPNDASKSQMTP